MKNWFKRNATATPAPATPIDLLAEARSHFKAGDLARAASSYRSLLDLKPDDVGVLVSLAYVLRRDRQLAEAKELLERAILIEGSRADLYYMVGEIALAEGASQAAVPYLEKAVALQPDLSFAHADLVQAWVQSGEIERALAAAQKGLEVNPHSADIHLSLGNIHALREEHGAAEKSYRRALLHAPALTTARIGMGVALQRLGRHQEGLEALRHAVETDDSDALARFTFAMGHLPPLIRTSAGTAEDYAAFTGALASFASWSEGQSFDESVVVAQLSPFGLAYREENHRALLAKYGAVCARLMARWQARQAFRLPPQANLPRIQIGIASPYFSSHSVWHALIKGWLKHIDRGRFDVHGFHYGDVKDTETQWAQAHLQSYAGEGADLRGWTQRILDKRIDVLIFPSVGLDALSTQLASMRIAAVQALAWGHPETSGLPTLDYYISADLLEPDDAQSSYSETLLPLTRLGCSYSPFIDPDPLPPLEDFGVDMRQPLLLCPGTPFKYAPEYDWVLPEIAKRIGICQMVFFRKREDDFADQLELRITAAFARVGLDATDHCRFIDWLAPGAFHALMQIATVFLDTIGFSGFNTAMQAIERGLPVVTREGRFMRGRLASGILKGIGMDELVAAHEEEYIALTVRLVQDNAYRQDVRARIAREAPRLFDDIAPVRMLEDRLESAVRSQRR